MCVQGMLQKYSYSYYYNLLVNYIIGFIPIPRPRKKRKERLATLRLAGRTTGLFFHILLLQPDYRGKKPISLAYCTLNKNAYAMYIYTYMHVFFLYGLDNDGS